MKLSITVPRRPPRNPLVVPARSRAAGAHRSHLDSQRQRGKRELRRLIEQTRQA
ncbi:hypothetical protein [Piscinibacter sakaiensis]|uniref:hypothetical protein n=1 Tax=Piscinibacter sakaiensis TaxID=1547922 RepID=UPI003AAB9277